MRAAGKVRLGQKGHFETYAATEVPAEGRADILTAYRKKAGREVNGYWKKLPRDPDHPTFDVQTPELTAPRSARLAGERSGQRSRLRDEQLDERRPDPHRIGLPWHVRDSWRPLSRLACRGATKK